MKIIYTRKGEEILVDDEYFEELSRYRWFVDSLGYCFRWTTKSEKSNGMPGRVKIHRQICGFPNGFEIDHRNHDKLDNRRSNLRICTSSQNHMNRKVQSNSKTGVTGVSYRKSHKKFVVQISINKKNQFLGYFNTLEEATEARKRAEELHFGEFRCKNS